uniref:IF rod domain-containing protein n=1 Tax=Cyclopterus lumpus TaxID=8103 RepID=A0A8C2X532_CYCLU
MELRSVRTSFHHGPPGEEKHQMLNLNRRLETYLGRVQLLEEENALLSGEIRGLRSSSRGASGRRWREGLEEELRRARLEVDAAWGDRVHAEVEAGRVAEELRALEEQRRREARAQAEAEGKLEQSRKELEEEQRAQVWLREQVGQLENQVRRLIRTHHEDVAHLEAAASRSRAAVAPTLAQRGYQTADLQQLGQEYSQRATRAWQEAAEAHQGHLDRLEESLHRARTHLAQVGQEKSESQLKLRALEKERESAQAARRHLETTAAQQGDRHSQEILHLQEHSDGLEEQKEELGRQVDHLVLENQGLLQHKASLGLEVAAYRYTASTAANMKTFTTMPGSRHPSMHCVSLPPCTFTMIM